MKKLWRSSKILEDLDKRNHNIVTKQYLEIEGLDLNLCTNPVSKDPKTGNQYYKLLDYWVIIHPDLEKIGIERITS
ncbi:MAG: hypothetical protein KAS71_11900 [Bacteroidales bacterium]|nr:hypothetical protein [Bacteroidales bacterium]